METTAPWMFTPRVWATRPRLADRYLSVLAVVLLGYALLSRTFAYVGVPPIFVGEIMMVFGLGVAVRSGALGEAMRSWTLRFWAVLFVWVLARTIPYLGTYQLDGPRDAMIVVYGFYAVIVATLCLARPARLVDLVTRYQTFVVVFLGVAWLVYLVAKQFDGALPTLPWAPGVQVLNAKGGDLMVHLTGIVGALFLGLTRTTALRLAAAAFSAGIIMISNRGGMVAFVVGLGLMWLLRPQGAGVGKFVYAFLFLMVLGLVIGPMIQVQVQGGTRDLSVEQVVENVKSVFGQSGSASLDGTREWRLQWWTDIMNYTVFGKYFVGGKGFGVNLANSDGYQVSDDESLRSPHNGHLTMLARAGVPGFLLWLAVHGVWFATVVGAWLRAKRADQRRWMALYAWVCGFWIASLLNASFDVFLEGPMGGIWTWTVMGLGVAAVRLRASHPDLLDAAPVPLPDPRGTPADALPTVAWGPVVSPETQADGQPAWGW